MISVLDHIEHLTAKHDCVIVPGLGAFISQYHTSRNTDGIIVCLKRSIAFNMSVDYNDGLLANSLMRRERVSFDTAKNLIDEYVCSLRCQLQHEGEVPVGRLGFLRYNGEDAIEFFPFASRCVNDEYFGLSEIVLKPLAELNQVQTVQEQKNVVIAPFVRKFMHVAASIILLLAMTFVLTTPVIEENNQNYANLNAFVVKSPSLNETQDIYIAIPKEQSQEKPVVSKSEIKEGNKNDTVKSSFQETSLLLGKYCLVIASLASQQQAEQYIQENKLTGCEITKSKSKYRVYVARGSYHEMITLKNNHYANSDAWVCKI